jgi:hypothetical protein
MVIFAKRRQQLVVVFCLPRRVPEDELRNAPRTNPKDRKILLHAQGSGESPEPPGTARETRTRAARDHAMR